MAERLSLKWIDGNDVVTLSGGTYTEPVDVHINGNTEGVPTFDVDSPTMWTPLSVLSGLASGFCERRAVLNSEFKTGASTSKTWLQHDDTPAAVADRAAIVSNCMHNLALGSDYTHLFYSSGANAVMTPIGSAAASNYMTAMDSAITAIVSGTNVYVDENGSSYESTGRAAFDGLASSAYITAGAQSAPGSSILRPSSGGGSSLKATMAIGLPVEWAKERKWMLDELKWTEGGGASTEQVLINDNINKIIFISSDSAYGGGVSGQQFYSAAVMGGVGDENYNRDLGTYINSSVGTSLMSNASIAYAHSAAVMYDETTPVSSGVATVYVGKAIGLGSATMDPVDYHELTTITAAVTADHDDRYCIAAGGILTIPAGISATAVFVESGATLQMSGGSVGTVNVMNGGRYLPNIVSGGSYIDSFDFREVFQNYTASTSITDANIGLYPTTVYSHMEYINDAVNTNQNVRNVYVTGMTATGSAKIVNNGTMSAFHGVAASRGKLSVSGAGVNACVIVHPGGEAEIGSGVALTTLEIASGGKATLHTSWTSLMNYMGLYVYSGGSLTLDGTPNRLNTRFNINIEEGAYLSIPAAAGLYKIYLTHNHYERPTSSYTFYTFITPSELITSMGSNGDIFDGGHYFGSATMYQFNNFGLAYVNGIDQPKVPFTEGWNRIPCSAAYEGEIIKLAGVDTLEEGKALAASASILPKTPRTAGASGTITFASWSIVATTTSSIDSGVVTNYTSTNNGTGTMESFAALYDHDRCMLINNIRKLAVNKLGGAKNHYPDFYVRQFPTPAEEEAAAQIIDSQTT